MHSREHGLVLDRALIRVFLGCARLPHLELLTAFPEQRTEFGPGLPVLRDNLPDLDRDIALVLGLDRVPECSYRFLEPDTRLPLVDPVGIQIGELGHNFLGLELGVSVIGGGRRGGDFRRGTKAVMAAGWAGRGIVDGTGGEKGGWGMRRH